MNIDPSLQMMSRLIYPKVPLFIIHQNENRSHAFKLLVFCVWEIFQIKEISASYRAIASQTLSKTKFPGDIEIPILNVNNIFLA